MHHNSTKMKPEPSYVRTLLTYGLGLGGGLALMTWADYRFLVVDHATELYVLLIAGLFTAVGIWVGLRWAAPQTSPAVPVPDAPPPPALPRQVLERHGISPREWEVLACLAQGLTNEEIAQTLFVSTNTVKTHLGSVYAKLAVSRRTQAIEKARTLGLLA